MKSAINIFGIICTGWEYLHPHATPDNLGYIPAFINSMDATPLAKQINKSYVSGWHPSNTQWIVDFFAKGAPILRYPGDPAMRPIAKYLHKLSGETLYLYENAVVMIVQTNGVDFEIARLD